MTSVQKLAMKTTIFALITSRCIGYPLSWKVHPVRNSSGGSNSAGIILGSDPAAEPCTAWCTGQSSGASFLTG